MKLRQNREIPKFSLFTITHSLLKDAKFSFDKKKVTKKKTSLSRQISLLIFSNVYLPLTFSRSYFSSSTILTSPLLSKIVLGYCVLSVFQ